MNFHFLASESRREAAHVLRTLLVLRHASALEKRLLIFEPFFKFVLLYFTIQSKCWPGRIFNFCSCSGINTNFRLPVAAALILHSPDTECMSWSVEESSYLNRLSSYCTTTSKDIYEHHILCTTNRL